MFVTVRPMSAIGALVAAYLAGYATAAHAGTVEFLTEDANAQGIPLTYTGGPVPLFTGHETIVKFDATNFPAFLIREDKGYFISIDGQKFAPENPTGAPAYLEVYDSTIVSEAAVFSYEAGNSIRSVRAIPEPSTLALLILGALSLFAFGKFDTHKARARL